MTKTQFQKWQKSNNRFYCLTLWKKPEVTLPTDVRYAIYGEEICPNTKNTHWQCYIELLKPMRFAAIKKLYNDDTMHIEEKYVWSTREEARDYCKKDNKFLEFGKWISGQGHRTDLFDVVDKMKSGTTLNEIKLEEPSLYCKYRNGLNDIYHTIKETNIEKFRKVEVILLTGPTGCGKTRLAMEEAEYKTEGYNLEWWQDYDNQKCILIDEYNNDIPIQKLLTLLDGYKLRLNVKGGHTYANFNKIYITTNLKIDEIHSQAKPAHRDALFRRITKIENFWNEVV